MQVKMSYDAQTKSIVEEINKIPGLTEEAEKKAYKEIGKIIVKNVKKHLKRSRVQNLKNYDGTRPYVHMDSDIKSTVSRKAGTVSLVVGGGKKTAYKWHLLDDGTVNANGTQHTPATHFTEKAMADSEKEIDALIDTLISEVVNGR